MYSWMPKFGTQLSEKCSAAPIVTGERSRVAPWQPVRTCQTAGEIDDAAQVVMPPAPTTVARM